jgi:hypothetical protein
VNARSVHLEQFNLFGIRDRVPHDFFRNIRNLVSFAADETEQRRGEQPAAQLADVALGVDASFCIGL